jgi:hypothetical protein
MEAAIRNYFAYQRHPHAWMLARFVCPVARLAELDTAIAKDFPHATVRLTVIGRPDKPLLGMDEIDTGIGPSKRLRVEGFEGRLPPNYAPEDVVALAEAQQSVQATNNPIALFLECHPSAKSVHDLALLAEHWSNQNTSVPLGWKIRLGGNAPFVIPSLNEVASFILACRDMGSCWKATAGLHQPLGGWDDEHKTFHFGFLSLFAASVLAQVHELDAQQIQDILQETDIGKFCFEDDGFAWRDFSANNGQIAWARKTSLVSFGSCSFEEPVQCLRQLNLLESGAQYE